jgi:hypothetical protein
MKKNLLILFVLAVVSIHFVFADAVDKELAAKVATSFCLNSFKNKNVSPVNLSLAYTEKCVNISSGKSKDLEDIPAFYIFNINQNDGFVMVSADNDVLPILGYSTIGSYTGKDLPQAFRKLMEKYKEEIRYVIVNKLKADNEIQVRWENLENGQPLNPSKDVKTVSPLLNTTWNQNPYENEMCPADAAGPGGHCVTGCPATAMAQIMKFWNYPTTGTGFHSYNASNTNGNYGTLSADFGNTTYNWGSMPDHLYSSNSAVALLMLHCGVAVEMNYGPNGSGGWVIENDQNGSHPYCSEVAYKTYFGYDASTLEGSTRASYSDAQWKQKLKTDLDASRPIQYAGWGSGGHTFVCDGYDQNDFFNMNWGWGGVYDGFFDLDALNPGTNYFNSNQQAVFGIKPGSQSSSTSIELYSAMTVAPNPINYGDGFTVTVDILNNGSANFVGDFTAALFTSDGTFVDYIEILTDADLAPGYYYDDVVFTSTGITAATPGNYLIGIYSRPTGGGWTALAPGSYANLISVTIQGTANDIRLYDNIVLDHDIVVGQPFTATTKIANYGASDFSGYVSLDLHSATGEWIQVIQEYTNVDMTSGYYYTFDFSSSGLNVPPGTYLLAAWSQPNGGDMAPVSSGTYTNPINIVISGQALAADSFEPDNTEVTANQLPVTFSGNTANCSTTGSNIHSSDDVDYYKISLHVGYTYTINAMVHDSYNNATSYTADVMFNFKSGTKWSDAYDSEMPIPFVMDGGDLTFNVFPFFPGEIGTYMLDINIARNPVGIESVQENSNIRVFPNPAQDYVTFQIDLQQPEIISGTLTNLYGQKVMEITKGLCPVGKSDIKVDVSSIAPGYYFYEFETQNGKTKGKLVITK